MKRACVGLALALCACPAPPPPVAPSGVAPAPEKARRWAVLGADFVDLDALESRPLPVPSEPFFPVAVDGDVAYYTDSDPQTGHLRAVDLRDGRQLWEWTSPDRGACRGLATTPGEVVCATRGGLHALAKASGAPRLVAPLEDAPLEMLVAGDDVVMWVRFGVSVFDLATGALRARREAPPLGSGYPHFLFAARGSDYCVGLGRDLGPNPWVIECPRRGLSARLEPEGEWLWPQSFTTEDALFATKTHARAVRLSDGAAELDERSPDGASRAWALVRGRRGLRVVSTDAAGTRVRGPGGEDLGGAPAPRGGDRLYALETAGCLVVAAHAIPLDDRLHVACIDPPRGKVVWERALEARGVVRVDLTARGGVTLVLGRRAGTQPVYLWAIDATGALRLERHPSD